MQEEVHVYNSVNYCERDFFFFFTCRWGISVKVGCLDFSLSTVATHQLLLDITSRNPTATLRADSTRSPSMPPPSFESVAGSVSGDVEVDGGADAVRISLQFPVDTGAAI
jgi:hypothetical protein